MPRSDLEDGQATIWVIGLATVMLMLVALVADGARVLSAVSETGDTARAAARAGALAVDPSGGAIAAEAAASEAAAVIATRSMSAETIRVAADGRQITVTVSTTIDLPLLALLGVPRRTVASTATSDLLEEVQP